MYILQASPYSKLWMRQFHKECEKNPKLVEEVSAFQVLIPRSAGAITLIHNQPVHIQKLLPRNPNQKADEHCPLERETLVEWLTGGVDGMRCNETDIYGVVALDLETDLSAAVINLVSAMGDENDKIKKDAEGELRELTRKVKEESKSKMKDARALADARVVRALKTTHRNLMKEYETMKQEGKGRYEPSIAEAIGTFILREELKTISQSRNEMLKGFDSVMRETHTLS